LYSTAGKILAVPRVGCQGFVMRGRIFPKARFQH
jgi:hypothetical protein